MASRARPTLHGSRFALTSDEKDSAYDSCAQRDPASTHTGATPKRIYGRDGDPQSPHARGQGPALAEFREHHELKGSPPTARGILSAARQSVPALCPRPEAQTTSGRLSTEISDRGRRPAAPIEQRRNVASNSTQGYPPVGDRRGTHEARHRPDQLFPVINYSPHRWREPDHS